MSDDKRVDVEFGAKIGGLVAGAREAAAVVKTTTTEMKASGEGLMKVFEAVSAHWAALLAVVAGGALFKEAIASTVEWTSEVVMLSKRLGITTEDASGLAVALEHVGVSADEYAGLVQKLTRQMRTNEQAFDTLGIKTKDQNGQWRNSQAVMADVIEKLGSMKAGTDRNVAAQALLGARIGNLNPILRMNAEMMAEAADKAEKYHLVVGPEGAAKVLAYKDALADLHLIGKSLSVQLGNVLLPVVLNLAQALGGEGPKVANFFAKALIFIAEAALEGYAALNALVELTKFMKVLLMTPVGKGWLGTVTDAWHQMGDEVTRVNEKVQDSIIKLRGFGGEKGGKPGAAPTGETLGGDDLKKDGKGKQAADERLAAWKDELTQIKQAEDLGKDTLLVDEISFWQKKLATIQGGSKADVKLRQQINAEIAAADKQLHADELRVQQIAIQTQREADLEALDVEKRSIQEKRALHQIDAKEEEAALLALNAHVTAIKLAALEEERALAVGDLVRQAEIDRQIAALKRSTAREVADIHKQTTVEITKDWDTVFDHISNVFSQTVTAIINGTQTLRGGLRSIFQNITLDFLASKLKELQHHAAIELAKRGITTTTAAHKVATESWAALKTLAIWAATTIKAIAMHAVHAMAAAWAAISAIPIVGPVLAPIVAGATLAAVLGLGSRISSAEGGYDIPHGLNPITQLHQDEMVLPAPLANAVRAMAAGGAGTGSGGGAVEHHYHVHAMDSRSFEEFARRNPAGFAKGVQEAVRNGHLSRST